MKRTLVVIACAGAVALGFLAGRGVEIEKRRFLQRDLGDVTQQRDDLQARVDAFSEESRKAQARADETVAAVTREKTELRKANAELQARIQSLEQKDTKSQAFQANLVELEKQRAEIQAKLNALKSDLRATTMRRF